MKYEVQQMNRTAASLNEPKGRREPNKTIYTLDQFIFKQDIIPIFYEENIIDVRMREMICLFYSIKDGAYKILMYTPTSPHEYKTTLAVLEKYTYTINRGTDFTKLADSLQNLSDFMRQHLFLFNIMFKNRKYIAQTIKLLYKHFNANKNNKNNKKATINGFSVNIAKANIFTDLFPRRDIYGKYQNDTPEILLYTDHEIISFGNINFVYTANSIIEQKSIISRIKIFINRTKQKIFVARFARAGYNL